ncbi:MAG: alpha/beta hydrolase [Wenzhouxiangella sp.]
MGIKSRRWRAPLALALALLAVQSVAETGRWADLEGCEFSAAGGRLTESARCGTLEVAENPARPEGRRIELAYAVTPARASAPRPDPVVFLAGGPGQSARDMLPMIKRALRDINRDRDLIFVDQRGTGGSNILDCSFDDSGEVWLEPDLEQTNERLRECLAGWDADVRFYTTGHGADDLEAFRREFGIEQFNLIGGSYGTRMAQVYLRRYPQRVRSVILDGVVPTRLHLGSEHAIMLDRALEKLFKACERKQVCAETFPGLSDAFVELKSQYRDEHRQIVITHPRTGRGFELEFGADVLASALRFLAYSPETQMLIPYLVHEAATTGSPERLASQAVIVTDRMSDMIAIGLNFAVGCSEDWPGWPDDTDAAGTLLGESMKEIYAKVCDWWPSGEVPDDFHQPFDSDVPVLILSGELDPVTPPAYGDEAAAQFGNSRHLIAEGRGHIVLSNQCVATIAAEFVDEASIDDLDTGCMDSIGPEPFFLDLLGPAP